jgi:SAM-dependent methyltransferase
MIAHAWRHSHEEVAWREWIAGLIVPDLGPTERILEVGCGGGLMFGALRKAFGKGLRYVGIDNADMMLDLARSTYSEGTFESGDGFGLAFADRSFGAVLAVSVLGHLPDCWPMLRELFRVVRQRVIASFWLPSPAREGPDGRLFTKPSYYVHTREAVEATIAAMPGGPWHTHWHDKPGFDHSLIVASRVPTQEVGEFATYKPSTVRILTLSNKPDLLEEAKASVARQTRQAGLVHQIAIDNGTRDWGGRYPPNVWINEMAERADPEDYLLFLSDDDLLLPNAVEDLAGYLDSHPDAMACYGAGTMYVHEPPKPDRALGRFPADTDEHGKRSLGGVVGSGMVMWRAKAWREVGPLPEQADSDTPLSDGAWFTKIAKRLGLYAIHKDVIYTRVTRQSAHSVPNQRGTAAVRADWRRLHGLKLAEPPAAATSGRYDSRAERAHAKGDKL